MIDKKKERIRQQRYRLKHREKILAKRKKERQKPEFKEKRRKYNLKVIEKKAGRKKPKQCEICGIPESDFKKGLCFDHDHKTGEFRGWLCSRCNLILGHAQDKVEILNLVIKYLKEHE